MHYVIALYPQIINSLKRELISVLNKSGAFPSSISI